MKLTQRLIVLLAVVITPFLLTAQAPGYLGKRAAVSFSLSGGVTIDGPNQNNKGSEFFGNQMSTDEGKIGFNHEFIFDFSYALSRYRGLQLSGSQYYTGMLSEARTIAVGGSGLDRHDLFYRLNVKSISLDYSFYSRKRGALAPVGSRYYFGLKTNIVSGKIIDKLTNYFDPAIGAVLGHKLLEVDPKENLYYFTWGWSNSSVIADKIIFKAGISGAIPVDWIIGRGAFEAFEGQNGDYFYRNNQSSFEENVYTRLWAHEILRINIGIGYLIF